MFPGIVLHGSDTGSVIAGDICSVIIESYSYTLKSETIFGN